MKILVDECLPGYLKSLFPASSAETVQEAGWSSLKNGPLLKLAEDTFDVFLTADQNLRYQQNLAGRRISILQLSTNKWRDIRAAAPLLQSAIATLQPGELRTLVIPPANI